MHLFDSSNPRLHIDKEMICRTPVFTLNDHASEKFEELKNIIKEASPSFYQLIASLKKEDIQQTGEKISFTLWKYFNRAKYRATPFGRFSGISIVPIGAGKGTIVLADNFQTHYFTDWQSIEADDAAVILARSSQFLTNTTLYKVGNEFRYILFEKDRFGMSAVTSFEELEFILDYCLKKKSKEVIYNQLMEVMHLSRSSITQLMIQLISAQLLIADITPNITGEDFFWRIPVKRRSENISPYIIAERKLIGGGYDNQSLKVLPELISFLNMHLPYHSNPDLQMFRRAFKKKFEMRFVPLTMAIDPEIGVGYANLERDELKEKAGDLSDRFKNRGASKQNQIRYDPFLVFLLNKSMNSSIIHLEEFDGKETGAPIPLPNTFSVILHHWNAFVVIEHIGGCTANALIGRFTMGSSAVEDMGKRLAAIEQAANPEVLFFDIAYQAERHVDNVNRRKALYAHELPILTWSCFDEPIRLDDILVGVKDAEIILFSKKHGKRMVPKIPSAYNYHRSDLPVFRFLCDMQHQGIRTQLNFKLNELIPQLEHYPRVMYKNIILFPETWQVPERLIEILSTKPVDSKDLLAQWLEKTGVNVPFKIGHADQTLVISPDSDEDLTALAIYCRTHRQERIYLSEACVTDDKRVVNESANPLAAHMILNYYHQQTIYKGINGSQHGINSGSEQHMIPPGKDWLYFAIYCHPSRSDELLVCKIAAYVKMNRDQINKWFFIRFDDGGPHLRLRLQMNQNGHLGGLAENLQRVLGSEIKNGQVADIQIKSYFREIARYGKERIGQVEEFFWHDSRYVLALLKRNQDSDMLYRSALTTLYRLIALSFQDRRHQIDFVNFMAATYSKEFSMNPDDYKKLNRAVRALNFNIFLDGDLNNATGRLKKHEYQFKKLIGLSAPGHDRYTLTADILHMHINRLFSSDQRTHEAILYQYLLQLLKSRDFQQLPAGAGA